MPVTINGSGSIAGLSVGGLGDGLLWMQDHIDECSDNC